MISWDNLLLWHSGGFILQPLVCYFSNGCAPPPPPNKIINNKRKKGNGKENLIVCVCICSSDLNTLGRIYFLLLYQEAAEVEEEEEESEEEVEDEQEKKKGTQGIIEIENPNLAKSKNVKAKDADMGRTTELSRRE
ncbi:uncharacterized protein LOC116125949, partial [Pistacia vera]|uniref:uncharacterized protein LOC116125949 n=1 Tax=Pistacia vera TaxID=55513 RepID=UPI001263D009